VIPRSSKLTLLACLIAHAAAAQVHVHFGVDAGVPLTDTLVSTENSSASGSGASSEFSFYRQNSDTKRLLIGPVFRLDLSNAFGIEFDALYQRINQDSTNISTSQGYSNFTFTQTIANRWQFPLLVQYRRTLPKTKSALFAEAGLSISHITNGQSVQSETTISNSSPSSSTSSFASSGATSAGVVAGAGADFPLFHGHLRPEFRYTHWFAPTTGSAVFALAIIPNGEVGSNLYLPSSLQLKNDEASFLLGFTF
jgi:hypothetical protein